MKICIQGGHVNRTSGNTGAPQERENNKRIADRLCAMLRDRGFEVVQTDANANSDPNITKTDFSLFLALHCDADIPNDGGSGFADYADPATDSATTESQRICKIINDVYFPETKIVYRNMSNINTRQYYMWKYLTPKTPCVLLEMGQSIDPHDSVLLGNTDLIASAITRALCKAFSVNYELSQPPVVIPTVPQCDCNALKNEILALTNSLNVAKSDFETKLSVKDNECLNKITTYKEKIIQFINSL